MTKEEAKEILISTLRDINSNDNSFEYTTEQFTEATLIAIESLSNPSLPSNLEEAADCYKDTVTPEEVDDSEHAISYETYTGYQIADAFKAGAEWMAGQGWHDVTETPSIFGFYLVIHAKGWCVAYYMGKGVFCESGWVEAIHHIEIEHPQKWLDLRDLIPKKQ